MILRSDKESSLSREDRVMEMNLVLVDLLQQFICITSNRLK